MNILLTNDDGIYAPGLAALERALRRFGKVCVVAPSYEQSGVAHSITFLTPLLVKRVFVNDRHWGWTVNGSPADCVKIGIATIMPERPDLVVSGINGGLNAGINVLYSGTVAAAVEGAFYDVPSIAVSLEYHTNEPFDAAADVAAGVIEKILKHKQGSGLFNLNIPLAALGQKRPEVKIVPMDTSHYWETFEERVDPMGRTYYWLSGRPDPRQPPSNSGGRMSDMQALSKGYVTLTPLNYDVTDRKRMDFLDTLDMTPDIVAGTEQHTGPRLRVSR